MIFIGKMSRKNPLNSSYFKIIAPLI